MKRCAFILIPAALLAGCKTIGIDLNTPEPINVNIAMRLDVYQHEDKAAAKKSTPPPADIAKARRDRMSEIQALKSSRIIGENHAGYLEVRNMPPGDYGGYVRKTVDAENADRARLVQQFAKERNVTVAEAERQQGENFRKGSYPGEWIEVPDAEGRFAWKQKE